MNITIYMGMSIDGQIARSNDETPWSDESWESFNTHVNNSDAMIIGRRTYEIMRDEASLDDIKVPVCVLSSSTSDNKDISFCTSVDEILEIAKKNNWQQIIVAGGGITNATFLKAGVVDRMIIDVEPIIIGSGKPLFDINLDELDVDFLTKFKLEEFKQLDGSNTIQLLYSIEK